MRELLIRLLFTITWILAGVIDANPSSPLTSKHTTAIVAAPDGTVYMVEIGSGKVLWSFSTGPSIYSSYQQIPDHKGEKLNASSDGENFYIDCGKDWELYRHGTGLKKVRLPITAEEFVKRTPFVAGGGVVLGSKKTSIFLVDAKTGKVVRTFRSDNLPSNVADESSSLTRTEIHEWVPPSSVDSEVIEKPLYLSRTDYALKYTSANTGKVLWYLMFADIEASFQCEGIENFLGIFPHDKQFRPGQGLDMKLPMHCETRPVVYRVRDRSSLEPLFITNGAQDALPGEVSFSLPASDQHAIEPVENLSAAHNINEKEIRHALPTSNSEEFITRTLPANSGPQIGQKESSSVAQPHFLSTILLPAVLVPLVVSVLVCVGGAVLWRGGKLSKVSEDLKLQNVRPKKKKGRKNRKHGITAEKRDLEGIRETETTNNALPLNPAGDYVNCTKTIGKIVVTNKQIGKGSNGTVVFEGLYEGRLVAVKRLVRIHHSLAKKEIDNLDLSDKHLNIIRYYGAEEDQDFVYLCLERCTCNLHDLISFCTSGKVSSWDQSELMRTFGSNVELNQLKKANGYPSPWLLKVMRDIVCGLAHLHDLGIVHRDLKPQNVLIIYRPLCAKISDMGISKLLDAEMSSLTKNATGFGTSGWQAPEQLRQERQTRAIDSFSLGCVLFFCMSGGNHAFGKNHQRDVNIVNDEKDLSLIEDIPEGMHLISRLLDANPYLRLKAVEVINHPLFWNSEMRLSFLRDASDRVELEKMKHSSQLLQELESKARVWDGGKWDKKIGVELQNDLMHPHHRRPYNANSVRGLLRLIRNKFNHYGELKEVVKAELGPLHEGFDSYFSTRFPKLLIEVYQVFLTHCAGEEVFQKYFRSNSL